MRAARKLPNHHPPLQGKRLLVTRPQHQVGSIAEKISALGGITVAIPAISIQPPSSYKPLDGTLHDLATFDWIVFTSVNGVKAVRDRLKANQLDLSLPDRCKLAAIGPATAKALSELWRAPDLVPDNYISDVIPEKLGAVSGKRVLLPRADIARKELANHLRELGAQVTEVDAYRIVPNQDRSCVELLSLEPEPNYILFTSSATVRGFEALARQVNRSELLTTVPLASIGPITADTVTELGYHSSIVAPEHTTQGLLDAVIDFERRNKV